MKCALRVILLIATGLMLIGHGHGQLLNLIHSSKTAEQSFGNGSPSQPWPISASINAMNYDIGGSGIGFNITPSGTCLNGSTAARPDTANLKVSTSGAPYQVGCTASGNSYKYTTNISGVGPFTITANLADSSAGGSWGISLDGTSVGSIATPNTGSFSTFQPASLSAPFNATPGNHIVQFTALGGDASFNTSGDFLSFQVTQASGGIPCGVGSNYTGTIPAAASVAGFTQCAMNLVFALPLYATQSNYMTCGVNSGDTTAVNAVTTQLWQDATNLSTMPCDVQQITDNLPNGDSSSVLEINWKPGYTGGGLAALQQIHTQNIFPINHYTQITMRTQTLPDISFPPGNDCGAYSIFWSFNNPGFEPDINESIMFDSPGGCGGTPNTCVTVHIWPANTSVSGGCTSYDLRQYATWGMRETGGTSDGTTAAFCTDFNGVRTSTGCITAAQPSGTIGNPKINMDMTVGEYCHNTFGDVSCKTPATTQIAILVKSVQIFVCPAWSPTNFNNCANTAITSNP